MKSIIKWVAAVSVVFSVAILSGCGAGNDNSANGSSGGGQGKELKYRVMPTASSDLFEAGIKPILEKKGYKLKAVKITDSIQREMALEEGAIDFHVDANQSYLQNFNKQKGTHLIGVLEIPTAPMGIYGGNRKTLDEVQDGDTIAIPNDATNISRAYQLLSRIGWVKLDPNKDVNLVTKDDAIENPKHLNFREMRGGTIASVRTDVAFIVLRGADAYNAKIDYDTALSAETRDNIAEPMELQLAVQEKNKDAAWVKDIIDAYHSPEFKKFMGTQSKFWIRPDYLK